MSGSFDILDPGLSTTIQDLGRSGWLSVGAPGGGALDPEAHRLANALVGAAPHAAALEIRYLGPSLRALSGPVRLALVGGDVAMRLERAEGGEAETIGPWRSVTLQPGDVLRVGALKGASTATLALSGGVAAPLVLGSRSTFARGGFGGREGRALRAGDRIDAAEARAASGADLWMPPQDRPALAPPPAEACARIRVIPGPQQDHFPEEALARFFRAEWRVSRDADRMGMRLTGARLTHHPDPKGANIVSEGIAAGSIQVPAAGEPILLLADRGTAGGYAKIAVAASVDLPLLGRLSPGARLRFERVEVETARAALRRREAALQRAIAAVAPYHQPGVVDESQLWSGNLITAVAEGDAGAGGR
ncbi:MAG: biotin-dependent carboxyltransferase family protein [Pseudomonadota bacterium]